MIRNVKTGNFHRHLPVQIGDLSKIGLRQAQEFFFLYNLQKTIYVWPQFEKQDWSHKKAIFIF